jgi:hypothetical protein
MALMRRLRPPRFALVGECHKCGDCCRQIVGNPPGFVRRGRLLSPADTHPQFVA